MVTKYRDIDKAYVSPYDKFLFEFDCHHEKSASQLKEIAKHQRIASRRDQSDAIESSVAQSKIWDKF